MKMNDNCTAVQTRYQKEIKSTLGCSITVISFESHGNGVAW